MLGAITLFTERNIFKSSISLKKTGLNNANKNLLKKIKLKNLIKVYLYGDKLYKERLNYV